jgi:hypothetical protein
LCLRHLLKSFGTNSFLGNIAHQLACASLEQSFLEEMEAAGYDLLELSNRGELDVQ